MANPIFSADVLAAAKDAGIPIAVTVGIVSIVTLALTLHARPASWKLFVPVLLFSSVGILSLLFVMWISTAEIYRWVDTRSLADWAGNDEGWTDGPVPEHARCDRQREGVLATCWRNRPSGWPESPPPTFTGTPKNPQWCTYKLREGIVLGKADGKATGQVFICARVSL